MTERHTLSSRGGDLTFAIREGRVALENLWALPCHSGASSAGPLGTRGLLECVIDQTRLTTDDMCLVESAFHPHQAVLAWMSSSGPRLRVESVWTLCPNTGVCRRADTIRNLSLQSLVLRRCLARFVFVPGFYEVYSQGSRWSGENQGVWRPMPHGDLSLRCEGGRTCQGASPYLCLKPQSSDRGVAFHLLPRGNWLIRVCAQTSGSIPSPPLFSADLGFDDGDLRFTLGPDGAVRLPEILLQHVPLGEVHLGAPALHRFLNEGCLRKRQRAAPVVYNTWFDRFDKIEPWRLKSQLAAAKDVGCEVFVVDAGWYGRGGGGWSRQVGDWREKTSGAFLGEMAAFADDVRAAGLGFGLWMEPERFHGQAPVVSAHPQWFLPVLEDYFYLDLERPEAYDYQRREIARLIDTYQLAWMKIDFNFELATDPRGGAFAWYYDAWYRLLEQLRGDYPQVFFEGCASGGLRMDLNILQRFDGHFLSDTVNPTDTIRILQGALLRVPPGSAITWAVVRPPEEAVPPGVVLVPGSACWEDPVLVHIDFAARAAMSGHFGLSGDLAGLCPDSLARLASHVAFYKKWRDFIRDAHAHMLTPPQAEAGPRGVGRDPTGGSG